MRGGRMLCVRLLRRRLRGLEFTTTKFSALSFHRAGSLKFRLKSATRDGEKRLYVGAVSMAFRHNLKRTRTPPQSSPFAMTPSPSSTITKPARIGLRRLCDRSPTHGRRYSKAAPCGSNAPPIRVISRLPICSGPQKHSARWGIPSHRWRSDKPIRARLHHTRCRIAEHVIRTDD
jgi:hypothetical protein